MVIIVFMVITIYVYNLRKNSSKVFSLSEQVYPGISLQIRIKKHRGKINGILITLMNKDRLVINDIKAELITGKREFNYYNHNKLPLQIELPVIIDSGNGFETEIPFLSFKEIMSEGDLPFRTFRLVIVTDDGKTYKSHELGFNSKWVIYRPDTGSYN